MSADRPGPIGPQPGPTIERLCHRGADPLFGPAEDCENPRKYPFGRVWSAEPHLGIGAKRLISQQMKKSVKTECGPFVSTGAALSRRSFLRGAGILLSLPL